MKFSDWIYSFGVQSSSNGELCLTCPSCRRPKLYFNLAKRIGHCHFDKCRFHVQPATIRRLREYTRLSFDKFDTVEEKPEVPYAETVEMPEGSEPLVSMDKGQFITRYPVAAEEVTKRGIQYPLQYKYDFHFDGDRVYVPVFYKNKRVSYVGRAAWWFPNEMLRYRYPTGTKIGNYLFDWDSLLLRFEYDPVLVLVENTFNCINYNNNLIHNVSTNFGSHLSDSQIDMILASGVKQVCLLWDGGSQQSAARAAGKLRDFGVNCSYLSLPGKDQPDSYPIEKVNSFINLLKENTSKVRVEIV